MRRSLYRFMIMIGVMGLGPAAYALTCKDVTEFTHTFIESHLTHEKLTPELMQLALEEYIELWDPSKNYFLKSDIDKFNREVGPVLARSIKDGDCEPLRRVAAVFMERLDATHQAITELIVMEHDFTLRETLILDADYRDFASSVAQRTENWRKRIKYNHLQLRDTLTATEARQRLTKRYELMRKDFHNYDVGDVYVTFLKAFGAALDPHSMYLSEDDLKDFHISFSLSLEGIGVSISSQEGIVRVNQVLPGGAAYKQGELQAGDKILAVAQGDGELVDVIDQNLSDVVKLIRGKRGTMVRLLILRKDGGQNLKKEVAIVREKINLTDAQVQHHRYHIFDPLNVKVLRIGVVTVPSFYSSHIGSRQRSKKNRRSVAADVEVATKQLVAQGVDALVVDLRNNGGGGLDEVVTMTGLFIPNGPVVQTKDQDIEVTKARDFKVIYDGPMVVLVDLLSASASEIFAGAMLDHNRALLVGDEHTFGKGTVQQQFLLRDGKGALNVTSSKFYSPAGHSTQKRGVPTQIVFPSLYKEYEIGERFRATALPWDQIPTTKLLKLGRTSPHMILTLAQLSERRRASDPQFLGLNKDILRVRANKVDGTPVSLRWKPDLKQAAASAADEAEDAWSPRDEAGYKPPVLSVDYQLRETLFIAGDYAHMLQQQTPAGRYQAFPHPDDEPGPCLAMASMQLLFGC